MSDFGKLLEEKCMNFSIRIVGLCKFLNEEKHEYRIADQMFRSGTSIGANIAEAVYGSSRKDFAAKLQIAAKEAAETIYWLELLNSCSYIPDKLYLSLHSECSELLAILSASICSCKT